MDLQKLNQKKPTISVLLVDREHEALVKQQERMQTPNHITKKVPSRTGSDTGGASGGEAVSPPSWRQFNRVQTILEDEPAARRLLGNRTHEVQKPNGKTIKVSELTAMVVHGFLSDNKDVAKASKREVVAMASRVFQRHNTATPNQAGNAPPDGSCPPTPDADEGVDSVANGDGDEADIQTPTSLPVEVPANALKVRDGDDNELATPLSNEEQKELQRHEKTIAKGWKTLVDASLALLAIRDRRLYRAVAATFEEYCQRRWALARSTAYQRIEFAQTHMALSAVADIPMPVNERQVRALAGLSPEDKLRVWREAVHHAPEGKPTYKDVKQAKIRLGLATATPTKDGSKAKDDDTDKASGPSKEVKGTFNAKARWKAFRDILDQEYAAWPEDCRLIFVHNLRGCVEDWNDAANKTAAAGSNGQAGGMNLEATA